jgi:hypothetical protein
MEKIVNLQYEEQTFPIRITCLLDKLGKVTYKSELLGSSISTFPYYQIITGETEKEALENLGKILIKSLNDLLDI